MNPEPPFASFAPFVVEIHFPERDPSPVAQDDKIDAQNDTDLFPFQHVPIVWRQHPPKLFGTLARKLGADTAALLRYPPVVGRALGRIIGMILPALLQRLPCSLLAHGGAIKTLFAKRALTGDKDRRDENGARQ